MSEEQSPTWIRIETDRLVDVVNGYPCFIDDMPSINGYRISIVRGFPHCSEQEAKVIAEKLVNQLPAIDNDYWKTDSFFKE